MIAAYATYMREQFDVVRQQVRWSCTASWGGGAGSRCCPAELRDCTRPHGSPFRCWRVCSLCGLGQNLDGRKMSDELVKFVKERVALEEAYAKGLAKLSTSCTLPRHAWRHCCLPRRVAHTLTRTHVAAGCGCVGRQTWVL